MNNRSAQSLVTVLGIDLAKSYFQLHGVDTAGNTVIRNELSRNKLVPFIAQLPPCLIGIESCDGANHWVRVFERFGHVVKVMAPQFVKPYVKFNQSDAADAKAICEAVQRPNMRFVPAKNLEQQDLQSLHRIRSQAVARRTAQANQIRGLLMEYGLVLPQSVTQIRKAIPSILEDDENELTVLLRELLAALYREMVHLDNRIQMLETTLEAICAQNEGYQRLLSVPGVGPLSPTALVEAIGDINVFKKWTRTGGLARSSAQTTFNWWKTVVTGHQ